jgi:hypothetical protein
MLTSSYTDLAKHLEFLQVHLKEGEWDIHHKTVQGPDTDKKFGVIYLSKRHMTPASDKVFEKILQQPEPMILK